MHESKDVVALAIPSPWLHQSTMIRPMCCRYTAAASCLFVVHCFVRADLLFIMSLCVMCCRCYLQANIQDPLMPSALSTSCGRTTNAICLSWTASLCTLAT